VRKRRHLQQSFADIDRAAEECPSSQSTGHHQARAREASLAQDSAAWRGRFEARPPRDQDVARIRQLEGIVAEREEALRGAEARMAALRNELLLR
jgi:hypothetical protein